MEFLDEESRPRVLFQSRPSPSSQSQPQTLGLHKPSLFISLSLSTLLFALSLLYFQSEPLKSLLFWSALSLLLGPFAPSSLTGGDIRVGVGPILETPSQNDADVHDDSKKRMPNRRSKPRKLEEQGFNSNPTIVNELGKSEKNGDLLKKRDENCGNGSVIVEEERDWSEGDVELLKKQLVKHPVGKPRRWEVIAEAFRGRHGVESVIKKAKSMGEKKMSDADSFSRFLKDRKPVDKRVEDGSEEMGGGVVENGEVRRESDEMKRESGGLSWSAGEDIALLNALKTFPKEVSMRWEKIAAAVPGKSKAQCMKRVAELKKGFRSSKASSEA
ncbi:transcription factor MAMYB [Cornus florida]|uniref:transcription factor MAMYB n=1 Tax=Cornus florida TaxID=4283 RepID=UPI002898DD90|nr:transcription factor MAMYB [Cornus florida]